MFIYQANPSQCLQFHRAARSLWAWTTGRPVPVRPHKRSPEAARIALIIIDPHDLGVCFIDTSVLTKGFRASVDSIRDWPLGHGQSKVPSRIAYTEPNEGGTPRRRAWGFEVLPGMSSCSWIKLLLDADARLTEFDDDALNHAAALGIFYIPAGKAIVDVVADYLCRIYQYTWKALIKHIGEDIETLPVEFWFTVPATWSEQAKIQTKEAATRAGFGQRPNHGLFTTTEPEAAAQAVFEAYPAGFQVCLIVTFQEVDH